MSGLIDLAIEALRAPPIILSDSRGNPYPVIEFKALGRVVHVDTMLLKALTDDELQRARLLVREWEASALPTFKVKR